MRARRITVDNIDTTHKPTGNRFNDLKDRKFDRLKVTGYCGVGRTKSGNKLYYWWCDCSCGTKRVLVCRNNLITFHTTSCGCAASEVTVKRNTRHGHSVRGHKSREYVAWHSMRSRCFNATSDDYVDYGGRGITVCAEWLDVKIGFENFLADMGVCPKGHSLGRIDNNGPYSPDNCRWETSLQQASNKRNNRILEFKGKKQHLAAWARDLGLHASSLSERIAKWGVERALSKPKT